MLQPEGTENSLNNLLDVSIDSIPDIDLVFRNRKHERLARINPLDHYEVDCYNNVTIFTGENYRDALAVFSDSDVAAKAIIHVKGTRRITLLTNAPYMYLIEKAEEFITSASRSKASIGEMIASKEKSYANAI